MYDSLSSSEKHIAKCLLEEPTLVTRYSIRELAGRLHVSPATIVRLGKSLGFDGYKEFKQAVVYSLASYEDNGREHLSDISSQDSIREIAEKVTYKNIQSLEETLNFLNVEVIEKSDYMQTGASVWHGSIPLCGEGRKPEIPAREQDLFRDGRLAFPVSSGTECNG